MKLLKYCLSLSFIFCGCADATPKEKIPELTCPYILPTETDFPVSWVTLGKAPIGKLQLRETTIIYGDAKEEKERVTKAKERIFSDDMIDEWDDLKDSSKATSEYYADRKFDMSMMCTYGRTQQESFDINLNVVLLIPLPSKKYVTCLLVRRDADPTHEISCKVE